MITVPTIVQPMVSHVSNQRLCNQRLQHQWFYNQRLQNQWSNNQRLQNQWSNNQRLQNQWFTTPMVFRPVHQRFQHYQTLSWPTISQSTIFNQWFYSINDFHPSFSHFSSVDQNYTVLIETPKNHWIRDRWILNRWLSESLNIQWFIVVINVHWTNSGV